jgi:hypothetical protein
MTDTNAHSTAAHKIGAVGDARTRDTIRLYTPTTLLSTSLGQDFHSTSPITINGVIIFSATPIRVIGVTYPRRYPVHIEPTAKLALEFAEGWTMLPDELKSKCCRIIC